MQGAGQKYLNKPSYIGVAQSEILLFGNRNPVLYFRQRIQRPEFYNLMHKYKNDEKQNHRSTPLGGSKLVSIDGKFIHINAFRAAKKFS